MASGSAKRYAQAVVELAREKGSFDVWQRDLGSLRAVVSDADARSFLENPSVKASDKNQVVDSVLADAQPEARNLAHMLIERRRTGIIQDLADLFDEAVLAENGIALVDVTTAEPLDEAGQELVRDHLGRLLGKRIELRLREDPDIIGGFVARAGDQVIDGSVVNQLRRLRARLAAA
ncbi:MAG: ATP synthase F1 subunit delta [Chloroflexia bacterium]|nr:ATP synthase F1 subunit delta [Chloroflexia bacterium]